MKTVIIIIYFVFFFIAIPLKATTEILSQETSSQETSSQDVNANVSPPSTKVPSFAMAKTESSISTPEKALNPNVDRKNNPLTNLPIESFIAEEPLSQNQQILPKGVWHPRFIFGTISEVAHLFDYSSKLTSMSRYDMTFNAEFLREMQLSEDFDELYETLNELYPGEADNINLGSLKFGGGPEISYMGFALAYGLTDRWTIGAALPIVKMYGSVTMNVEGESTVSDIKQRIISSDVDSYQELIDGLDQLPQTQADLIDRFNEHLESKNFKGFDQIYFKGLGDLQIFSIYNYFNRSPWNFYFMTTVNLPTGPKDDPDNLVDLPNFAQTGVLFKSLHQFQASRRLTLGGALSYNWKLPDMAIQRVPTHEDDILPDEDRKEFLFRNIGDILSLEAFSNFRINSFLSFDMALSLSFKNSDRYNGDRLDYNYSLLERETNSKAHWLNGRLGVHLSSISWFQKGNFPLPFVLSYNHSDIFYGRNVRREVRHELSLLLFL